MTLPLLLAPRPARFAIPWIANRESSIKPQSVTVGHLVPVIPDRLLYHRGLGAAALQTVPVVGRLGIRRSTTHQPHRDAFLVHDAQHVLSPGVLPCLLDIDVLDLRRGAARQDREFPLREL